MRFWHHIIAAVVGLVLAAALVTVAFRQADESGSAQSGKAPEQVAANDADSSEGASAANPDCGRQTPGEGRKQASITQALTALPQVYDGQGRLVEVQRDTQKRWFARVQSFGGTCVDEVAVSERDLKIVMTFPPTIDGPARTGYLFGAIDAAFQAPLARRLVTITWAGPEKDGTVVVRSGAWTQFRQSRAALGLPNTLDGLARYGRRVGLKPQELQITES